jgi:hypothetical protein
LKKIIYLLIIVFAVTCAGCGTPKKSYVSLNDEIKAANKSRIDTKPLPDINKYLYKYSDNDKGFTDSEVSMLTNIDQNNPWKDFDYNKILTKDMALSDIDYLFRLLKYAYGGYEYFGGDKVFNAVKDKIVNQIKNEDSIKASEMNDLIGQYFDFIKDSHFRIGSYSPMAEYRNVYYYNEEYEFYKDEKGYYTIVDNEKYYLKSIQNSDKVQEDMKLTINKDGELVYNIGLLHKIDDSILVSDIKLINDKKELNKEILLTRAKTLNRDNKIGFSKKIINGIPVVTCTRMMDYGDNDDTCKLFSESGKELKKYPVSIIDIRGNGGGYEESGIEWFEGYTGHNANCKVKDACLLSKIAIYQGMKWDNEVIKNKNNITYENYLKRTEGYSSLYDLIKNNKFNEWQITSYDNQFVDNKNTIFVLIDSNVMSAGELYIEKLRTLKNVIFVGTNTYGCDLVYGDVWYKLPNSGEPIFFGEGMRFRSNFEEGTGYMPDIWVNSCDALERVEKLIEKSKSK